MAGHIAFKNASFPGAVGTSLASIAADSTDGGSPNWSVPAGTYQANGSGQVVSPSSVTSVAVPNLPCPADGNYDLDIAFSTTGGFSLYTCNGNTEYYLLSFTSGSLAVSRSSAAGGTTSLATYSVNSSTTATVKAVFRRSGGTGTVAVTVGGSLLGTSTDTAPPPTSGANTSSLVAITSALTVNSYAVTLPPAANATWTGPTTSAAGTQSTAWTVTLDHPAGAGGIAVALASDKAGDRFQATSGGGNVTSITIADGSSTGTFYLRQAAAGPSVITPTAPGVAFSTATRTVTASSGSSPVAGIASPGVTTSATAAATATDATGGTAPYTYQWYRSTTAGSLGTAVSGQASLTLVDAGLTASTTYYYTLRYTDASSVHVDSNQVTETTAIGGQVNPSAGGLSVYYPIASLSTIYFTVTKPPDLSWNGTAFEATSAANWSKYALAGTDPGGTGTYLADFPAGIPVGAYSIYGYRQVAGPAASTDTLIGTELNVTWDGTKLSTGLTQGSAFNGSGTTLPQATNSNLWGTIDRLVASNSLTPAAIAHLNLPRQGKAQQFWDGFEQLATSYFAGDPVDAGDSLTRLVDYATALGAQAAVAGEIVALVAANPGTLRAVIDSTHTAVRTVRTFPGPTTA